MPPKKRSRKPSQSDGADSNKQQKTGSVDDAAHDTEDSDGSSGDEQEKKRRTFFDNVKSDEYVIIPQPRWDLALDTDEEESESEEERGVHGDDEASEWYEMWPKPLSEGSKLSDQGVEGPRGWRWLTTWESWQMLLKWQRHARYSNPDMFDMYTYNDHSAYAQLYLIEKAIHDFNTELNKKDRSIQSIWAIIAMLGHYLNSQDADMALHCDDGERVMGSMQVLGYAFITALHAVDSAGKLTQDSEFKDLGLVMSLYLRFANYCIEGVADDDGMEWRETVVAYAKKANIDIRKIGCSPLATDPGWREEWDSVEALKDAPKSKQADRWGWKKKLAAQKKNHGFAVDAPFYGPCFDITKWSREERAEYALDEGVDPLADMSEEALQNDQLDWA